MTKRDPWIENRRHIKNYPHKKSVHIPRSTIKALPRICVICGETDQTKLIIDHINHNSLDNRPENLQILCVKCHKDKTGSHSGYASFLEYDLKRHYPKR